MAPNSTEEKPINPNIFLEIPKWINESYFESILIQDVPEFSKIVNFTPVAATAPGENYTSIMVRVFIDIELKDGSIIKKSYILKTSFEYSNDAGAMISAINLFPKEKHMYQNVLPEFEKLYKEAGRNIQLGPKCLHVDDTPERITLVLEDLSSENFVNMDRLKGLDMTHMTVLVRKLAELHAVSAVYYEINGSYGDLFQITFFCEANRQLFEVMGKKRHEIFLKSMRQWGLENVEKYIEKFPIPDDVFDEGIRLNKFDPDEFNVLNHGDCWTNNFMFQHDENKQISKMLFVDFQVGKWGSPAQDLWYMILSSAAEDIRIKEFDNFIYIYHEHLVECLKLLKYSKPLPKLKDLQSMILKYGFWGLLTATGVMSAILLPSDKDANMENMLKTGPESEEFHLKTFTNPYYKQAMLQLFPFLDHKGLLEI